MAQQKNFVFDFIFSTFCLISFCLFAYTKELIEEKKDIIKVKCFFSYFFALFDFDLKLCLCFK